MTEGVPAALATANDVQRRWSSYTDARQAEVETRLGDASALLRTVIPDIDVRAAAKPNLQALVVSRVADTVARYMRNPDGAKQLQETIGDRSYSTTLDSGSPTGIFFTDGELAGLRPSAAADARAGTALGTAFATARPGWAPVSSGWGGW